MTLKMSGNTSCRPLCLVGFWESISGERVLLHQCKSSLRDSQHGQHQDILMMAMLAGISMSAFFIRWGALRLTTYTLFSTIINIQKKMFSCSLNYSILLFDVFQSMCDVFFFTDSCYIFNHIITI